MRYTTLFLVLLITACSGHKNGERALLLHQMKHSSYTKDWFVPFLPAIDGLDEVQANYKDSTGNHSIKEITAHIVFWNERQLRGFMKLEPEDFSENNEETFTSELYWEMLCARADSIESAWIQELEKSGEQQIIDWAGELSNISLHRAYHTGQIVYIRKQRGWWNNDKGVQ